MTMPPINQLAVPVAGPSAKLTNPTTAAMANAGNALDAAASACSLHSSGETSKLCRLGSVRFIPSSIIVFPTKNESAVAMFKEISMIRFDAVLVAQMKRPSCEHWRLSGGSKA